MGDLMGNLIDDLTCDLMGDLIDDLTGDLIDDLTGHLIDDLMGDLIDDLRLRPDGSCILPLSPLWRLLRLHTVRYWGSRFRAHLGRRVFLFLQRMDLHSASVAALAAPSLSPSSVLGLALFALARKGAFFFSLVCHELVFMISFLWSCFQILVKN